ncbi:MAG: RnfABCDGE type electron transport complex subunit A [Lachnospiraceae bacterium]|nr:RnfABCDGE type electron transport complex subunit A [Lachnospiraceae bacterium]
MTSLIMIIVTNALVSNVVLSQFLGICSFVGVSRQIKTSASLGAAVIFVMTIASAVASLLYDFILVPFDLDYLKTIVFILVIAALVQLVEMFLKKTSRGIYEALGIYLPLITTNCAVLGVALTNVQNGYNLVESVFAGFGTAVGYTIAIVVLAGIRGRLDEEAIPLPFRGAPIVLLCAALMSIAFMGFSGL